MSSAFKESHNVAHVCVDVQTALGQLAPDSPLVDPLTALLGTSGAASAALDAAITAGLTAEALPAVAAAISDALSESAIPRNAPF